jgi:hypothetical protein
MEAVSDELLEFFAVLGMDDLLDELLESGAVGAGVIRYRESTPEVIVGTMRGKVRVGRAGDVQHAVLNTEHPIGSAKVIDGNRTTRPEPVEDLPLFPWGEMPPEHAVEVLSNHSLGIILVAPGILIIAIENACLPLNLEIVFGSELFDATVSGFLRRSIGVVVGSFNLSPSGAVGYVTEVFVVRFVLGFGRWLHQLLSWLSVLPDISTEQTPRPLLRNEP